MYNIYIYLFAVFFFSFWQVFRLISLTNPEIPLYAFRGGGLDSVHSPEGESWTVYTLKRGRAGHCKLSRWGESWTVYTLQRGSAGHCTISRGGRARQCTRTLSRGIELDSVHSPEREGWTVYTLCKAQVDLAAYSFMTF